MDGRVFFYSMVVNIKQPRAKKSKEEDFTLEKRRAKNSPRRGKERGDKKERKKGFC